MGQVNDKEAEELRKVLQVADTTGSGRRVQSLFVCLSFCCMRV